MKCFSRLVSHSALAVLRNYVSLRTDMDMGRSRKRPAETNGLIGREAHTFLLLYNSSTLKQFETPHSRLCQGTHVSITAPDIGLFPIRRQPPEGAREGFRPFKCIFLLPIPAGKDKTSMIIIHVTLPVFQNAIQSFLVFKRSYLAIKNRNLWTEKKGSLFLC